MEFLGLAQTFRLPVSAVTGYVPLSSRKVIIDGGFFFSCVYNNVHGFSNSYLRDLLFLSVYLASKMLEDLYIHKALVA